MDKLTAAVMEIGLDKSNDEILATMQAGIPEARRQVEVSQKWATVVNEMISPMLDTASWDEIKAAIAKVK